MMMFLKDQVAVIAGASSGIGKSIAVGLAEKGSKLCLLGRKIDTLEAVAKVARKSASLVKSYQVDLTIDEDIRKLTEFIKRDFEYIDILVHSAGAISLGRLESAPVEDFDWQYKTNVRAPYLLTQTLLPMMRSRRGQIVFINSSAGLTAAPNLGQYAATKHALKAIADSFRQEINAEGLRVLSVFPGRTATPMQASLFEQEGREYKPEELMQPGDVAEMVIGALASERSMEVTDIIMRPLRKM